MCYYFLKKINTIFKSSVMKKEPEKEAAARLQHRQKQTKKKNEECV